MKPIFQTHRCLSARELHQYAIGQLSGAERHRVENHLLDCALCNDAVEGRTARPDRDAAPLPTANAFLASLATAPEASTVATSPPTEEAKVRTLPRRRPWLQYAAAACVVALATVSVWYFQETNKHDRIIAQEYHTPDAEVINPRGGRVVPLETSKLDEAMTAYDEAAYDRSAALFAEVVAAEPTNEDALYYGGLSQLENGDTAAAIQLFERTLAIGNKYPDEALFHLAISHLSRHEVTQARVYLKQLTADESGLYYGRAQEMLSQL